MAISLKDLTVIALLLAIIYLITVAFFPEANLQVLHFPLSGKATQELSKEIDNEIAGIQNIITAGYQLDVEINSAHIAKHGADAANAIKCLRNNGNISAFSEWRSRRVHLLCWDETTKTLYDVIINKINYYVNKLSNPQTELITAYSPSNVNGATMLEKVSYYLEHLSKTIGGKVVRLKFGPGEVQFFVK